jgi:hypothetical protein
MKSVLTLVAAAAVFVTMSSFHPALAQQNADDVKWITECVSDNKDEGQTAPVILGYCTCMNNKMSSNETRSITQWEKSNPRAVEACARQAGWKGR